MKKSILTCVVLLIAATSFSFANPADEVNGNVKNSFKKDFQDAREVKWEARKIFIKATFILNEKVTYAYYSQDGDLIAVTRNILSTQLPITQLMSLNKNYKGYWITDLFEMNSNHQTCYYITLENADYKMTLKSDNNDGWDEYKKEAKQ